MSDSGKAVFLSYASQDAEAAKRICEALRAAGVEVWFDQSELRGGDAWDAKIRKQIKECALFVPVITPNTNARAEGYFRLEWKLAVDRSHLMADDAPFLFPIAIGDVNDATARVPDKFRDVQWTRLRLDEAPTEIAARLAKILEEEGERDRRSVPASGETEAGRPARASKSRRDRPAWMRHAWAGLAMLVVLFYATRPLWRGQREPELRPTVPDPAAGPEAEARRLTARAAQLTSNMSPALDDLKLASDLVEKAMRLAPEDAETWAVAAAVDVYYVLFRYDDAATRRDQANARSLRAMQLDPRSFSARLSRAAVLSSVLGQLVLQPEAEAILQELIRERPDDRTALSVLALCVGRQGRREEAGNYFMRARNFSGAVWQYLAAEKIDQAEDAARRAVAEKPSTTNLETLAEIESRGREDLDAALAALNRIPAAELLDDHPATTMFHTLMLRREPEKALEVLRRIPREWLASTAYTGPAALLTGRAHREAGRLEAAPADWRVALRLIEEKLAAQANAPALLALRAELLAHLGEIGEGRRVWLLERQLSGRKADDFTGAAATALRLGWKDEVLAWLVGAARPSDLAGDFRNFHLNLRYSPDYDALRGNPRFEQFLRDNLPQGANPFENPKTADHGPQAAAPAVDTKSVAVLAFANLSDDKANEYFSDGISEELLNVLAKVSGLKVTARTSSFHFKGKDTPIPEIARQLGVAYVVEGSVRKAGDKVRITAQLIKAADGFHIWSDTFTRDLKDIFAVQDEIAGLIAGNLQLKMDLAPARRAVNPEAHRLVLEGRHYWNLRTDDGFTRAEAAFRSAIALDPDFAEAHAGLANVLATVFAYRFYAGLVDSSPAAALAEAQLAIKLDPALAEAYPTLGLVYNLAGRPREAEPMYQKALELNPNYALPHHWYAIALEMGGRIDEALAEIERAIQLDPLSAIALVTRRRMLTEAGQPAAALAAYEREKALVPDRPAAEGYRALCLLQLGRHEEAIAVARQVAALPTMELRLWADADIICLLRQTGHEAEAAEHGTRIVPRFHAGSYQRGAVLAALGRWDEAEPFLERTPINVQYMFYWSPVWDAWRDDPRFRRLLTKLGCLDAYQRARETYARLGAK